MTFQEHVAFINPQSPGTSALCEKIFCYASLFLHLFRCSSRVRDLSCSSLGTFYCSSPAQRAKENHKFWSKIEHAAERATILPRSRWPLCLSSSTFGITTQYQESADAYVSSKWHDKDVDLDKLGEVAPWTTPCVARTHHQGPQEDFSNENTGVKAIQVAQGAARYS